MKINREQLEKELLRWQQLAENIQSGLEESQSDSLSELSTYDNHPADLGDETFERSKDLSLLERARTRIQSLKDALTRLDEGQYGICLRCGKPIAQARLQTIPEAELCAACQKESESDSSVRKRPLEEKVLSPPFARTFTDGSDSTAFDGEDAWQAVARYGTSESPQDVPGSVTYNDLVSDSDEKIGAVEDVEELSPADEDPTLSPLFAEPNIRKRAIRGPKNEHNSDLE